MSNYLATTDADSFELAAELADLAINDSGSGNENLDNSDIQIPRLKILQKMSEEVDSEDPSYVEGAKPGQIFCTTTKELFEATKGVLVIPVVYEKNIVEWIPKEKGGGLQGVHPLGTPLMQEATLNEKRIPVLSNGNMLVETATHYCLYQNTLGMWVPVVISFKSTGLKRSRAWNTQIKDQLIPGTATPAPRWLYAWRLTTERETKGENSWYSFSSNKESIVTKELYMQSKGLYESYDKMIAAAVAAAEPPLATGDDIPF